MNRFLFGIYPFGKCRAWSKMSAFRLRNVVTLAVCRSRETVFIQNVPLPPLLACIPPVILGSHRSAHTQKLTKNIQYISNDNVKLKTELNTLILNKRIEKPLCIIMNWMMARPSHVMKYAKLYLEHGFDVISVSCTPWQLMWPATGSQMIGKELLKFLESNVHKPLVVHGFSVGAYVWSELLVQTTYDRERYQPVLDRIKAQVWDSPADFHEIKVEFPSAVFPENRLLQETFRSYVKTHMKVFHKVATRHYMKATEVFHATPCRAPGLFLVSRTDPVGVAHRSQHARDTWENMGIECNLKCWDKSPHVQHYIHHPEEYRAALYSHLQHFQLIPRRDEELVNKEGS